MILGLDDVPSGYTVSWEDAALNRAFRFFQGTNSWISSSCFKETLFEAVREYKLQYSLYLDNLVPLPENIGDQSFAYRVTSQLVGAYGEILYENGFGIYFRKANVCAHVSATDLSGTTTLNDVIGYARIMENKMN
jgi:hypothetical protein